jgi:hypothetical protein
MFYFLLLYVLINNIFVKEWIGLSTAVDGVLRPSKSVKDDEIAAPPTSDFQSTSDEHDEISSPLRAPSKTRLLNGRESPPKNGSFNEWHQDNLKPVIWTNCDDSHL